MNYLKLFFVFFSLFFLLLLLSEPVHAQASSSHPYVIDEFSSRITIQQDTTLQVIETIKVDFHEPRHGIIRKIPIVYPVEGGQVEADFEVLSVKDELGNLYTYTQSFEGSDAVLKIGDPDVFVQGPTTYVITYTINNIIERFEGYDELYWNTTGSEWDTVIQNTTVSVVSPYAEITKTVCFAGRIGTNEAFCRSSFTSHEASASATISLGGKRDLTIVVGLNKESLLSFPPSAFVAKSNTTPGLVWTVFFYLASLSPLSVIWFWWRRGRDKKYVEGNIYYTPENTKTRSVGIFEREHLPLVYHPIQGLTPAEIGTLNDDSVNMNDVIAEVVELARLGFCEIEKVERKGLFISRRKDYLLVRSKGKEISELKSYQQYLLTELFKDENIANSVEELKKISDSGKLLKKYKDSEVVVISALKSKFYKSINEFTDKLYDVLEKEGLYTKNPKSVRSRWLIISVLMGVVGIALSSAYLAITSDPGPIILSFIMLVLAIIFSYFMPARTAKGYSLYRQIKGLKWYLEKGKYRHEIAEKHLFLEEILPIAIALGVVNKLASDMAKLGVEPPSYMHGFVASSLASDLTSFQSGSIRSMGVSRSGSGFSAGSVGEGGGGGGGGSW